MTLRPSREVPDAGDGRLLAVAVAVAVDGPPDGALQQREAPGEELIMHLERDQLVAETFQPLPRVRLSRRAKAGLWALRIATLLLSAMVIYTFLSQL